MLRINIITQLLMFFIGAISINLLNLKLLILLLALLVAMSVIINKNNFLNSILRFKWFFLVMLMVFAFNTPGEHIASWQFSLSPTYEGVAAGLTQMLRVLLMLVILSLILACNSRQQLISGLYYIFSPLQYLGLKVERFAVRLWLTLHYVELQDNEHDRQDIMHQLKHLTSLNQLHTDQNISVTFSVPQFEFLDYAVLATITISALIYMVKWFN